ncbi:MAG TPA: hypothetical protein VN890_06155, partial [Methylocella sp.]|nr:hypothetical protein [Methylocella sp.]
MLQKSRNLLSGFAAKNRGVLRSRSRNEFEAAAARKSEVSLQTRFNGMGLMRHAPPGAWREQANSGISGAAIINLITSTSMKTCIYCGLDKPDDAFRD